MHITHHIIALALVVFTAVPVTAHAFFSDAFFGEVDKIIRQSFEEGNSGASVYSETRAEASSSGGSSTSHVKVKTIINGEVVEDIDETVTNGEVEHETNIKEGGVNVRTHVKASADNGNGTSTSADEFADEIASTTKEFAEDIKRDVGTTTPIGERVREFTQRLLSLIDNYVFSLFR